MLQRFSVSLVADPHLGSDTATYDAYAEAVNKEDARYLAARAGTRINLGAGVYFDVLFPDRDVSGFAPNDASVVGVLSYGETSVLLTGDAPQKIERHLVHTYGDQLDVDILKLGHHGSKTASAATFLAAASPAYAVVSAGKNNRYGHPHEEVVARVREFDIPMVSTAEEGTIVFTSDGDEWKY